MQFSQKVAQAVSKAFGRPDTFFTIMCPWILKIFPDMARRKTNKSGYADVAEMIRELIESHKRTHDKNHPRDFIDLYLTEILNTKDRDSSFYGETGEDNLTTLLIDLFVGGDDTTPNAMNFGLLFLVGTDQCWRRSKLRLTMCWDPDILPWRTEISCHIHRPPFWRFYVVPILCLMEGHEVPLLMLLLKEFSSQKTQIFWAFLQKYYRGNTGKRETVSTRKGF